VNGEPVDEDYLAQGTRTEHLESTTVPSGFVYVLGDYRENSSDSRHYGPVSEASIRSKVVLDWSLDRWLLGAAAVLGIILAITVVSVIRRTSRSGI
jgi:signal peptidase I